MIVKILSSASVYFHGVEYNEKKINNEKGELMLMKNFPSFINKNSSQEEVRNYFKSISKNEKIKKPQFHAILSTKFQEHSKEELTQLADDFMKEMGYEEQPYIVVFHKDTDNNHVHIVSSRVDKNTGKKINDSFEKLKAQRALNSVLKKHFGIDKKDNLDKLLSYKYNNYQQLENLLYRNGFKAILDDKKIEVFQNGVHHKTLSLNEISYSEEVKDKRSKQIKAILEKYKDIYSNKVFKVIDDREINGLYERGEENEKNILPKIEYESELQQKLRHKFGIDIIFHFKENKQPFGYTLIDNANQKIYKGSNVVKMKEIFDFTEESINKKKFEQFKDYSFRSEKEKKIMLNFLCRTGQKIQDFMMFSNEQHKKQKPENYDEFKEEVKEYIKSPKRDEFISIEQDEEGRLYVIHQRYHQVYNLEELLKDDFNQKNINNSSKSPQNSSNIGQEIFDELLKSAYTGKDPAEQELKKRRKKRK
ncbi:hypothetical protein CAPN002_25960 [Capnocytophaga stomatis]|uniref:relaxase/mobilization nuclease domain-containing protein n=1 Tax=Capnocytophaga stomatis TaxID=1848904 RepID=UPI00195117C7|nr:relaxase/mobilization nuclease domain-containing protein [Capnocytophaga stomatis]GIJ95378.1 hypothetical protein CAPN002_25960 [Capnocytophaga stomatis]